MKERKIAAILLVLLLVARVCGASDPVVTADNGEGWKLASDSGGVAIYTRPRPGSGLKQFKAIGEIAAPTRTVRDVVADVDAYPRFMPFIVEARLVKREKNSFLTYQRLSPPFCSERDYTIRMIESSRTSNAGLTYSYRWEQANAFGPAEKPRIVRVKNCEGTWLLETLSPNKTRVTYFINTDNGGGIPAFIANTGSRIAIGKMFAGIRNQIKDPKYKR